MITVLAFARYRGLLGFSRLEVPLPQPPIVAELLAQYAFKALPGEALLALNQAYVKRGAPLADGDELALMPPVSGG